MDWPTWDQSAIAGLVCAAVYLAARAARPGRARAITMPAALELTLMCALYSVWRVARELPLAHDSGAIHRARQINDLQRTLHIPSELSLQHFVLDHEWLGRAMNYYYAIMHVPALITFMVWLFWRHRDRYAHWRNGLALLTAFCVVIRFVRVAPPRLVPGLGYIDLASVFGLSVYGPVGTGISDQFAAMPSIHVGWAAVVSFGVVACSRSKWRWVAMLHVVLTMLAVSATGNHWWADGIVAIALLGVGLLIDGTARRLIHRRDEPDAGSELECQPDGVALEPA